MGRVLFVHGTMTRYNEDYLKTFATITERLRAWQPSLQVDKIPWGEEFGSNMAPRFLSIPGFAQLADSAVLGAAPESAAVPADPIVTLWAALYADPLVELDALAMRDADLTAVSDPLVLGQSIDQTEVSSAFEVTLNYLAHQPLPEHIHELAEQGGVRFALPEACEALAELFRSGPHALRSVLRQIPAHLADDYRVALARAAVAKAMDDELQMRAYPALYTNAQLRDALVATLEQALQAQVGEPEVLGGGFGDSLSWLVAQPITRLILRPNRGQLTGSLLHFIGDVFAYQARGEEIRARIAAELENQPPTVLLAHSLGGIICFEMLLQRPELREKVPLLITLGSQTPIMYELNVLSQLRYQKDKAELALPADFPPWLNLFDQNDLLSFQTGGIFKGMVRDVSLDSIQPFPHAHNAYWENDLAWEHILAALAKPDQIQVQLR